MIAGLETRESINCQVSPEIALASPQSDFGRKRGYYLHVAINGKQDMLSAYGPDDCTLLSNLRDYVEISVTLA